MSVYGDANPAKRLDVRKKISDAKWKGSTFTCLTCGVVKRCMPSRVGIKHYCSVVCRGKATSLDTGAKARHWKGGRTVGRGYVHILKPDHPHARQTGYVPEHRLVVENHLGTILPRNIEVHHINGVKDDNRIENLLPLTREEHAKLHYSRRRLDSKCRLLPNSVL